MPTYKIIALKKAEDTLFTEVEYVNSDGKPIITVVAHFQPQTADEVAQNIESRFLSENKKLTATEICTLIFNELVIGKEVELP
jgi:hypothetical protein